MSHFVFFLLIMTDLYCFKVLTIRPWPSCTWGLFFFFYEYFCFALSSGSQTDSCRPLRPEPFLEKLFGVCRKSCVSLYHDFVYLKRIADETKIVWICLWIRSILMSLLTLHSGVALKSDSAWSSDRRSTICMWIRMSKWWLTINVHRDWFIYSFFFWFRVKILTYLCCQGLNVLLAELAVVRLTSWAQRWMISCSVIVCWKAPIKL